MKNPMTQRLLVSLFTIAALGVAQSAKADTYKVDPVHSSVNFEVRHIFSKVRGNFSEFEGTLDWDEKKPEVSKVDFKIMTKSINTGNKKREEHLQSSDFFDVAKFPEITFKSKKVTPAGKGKFKITGDMKMHGVTKEVTFDAEHLGSGKDPMGRETASFSAETKVDRKDFGIKWNKAADNGGFLLGDDVKIEIQVEADKEVPKNAAKKTDKK